MKLLVTGGTTFVSRCTAEYFVRKGHDVTVLNRGSRPQVEGVTLLSCDRHALGDRLQGRHFDAVLDICAYTAEDIAALLDAEMTFGDYIMVSSSAVYPETNPQPFTEEQDCGPNAIWGSYGVNKLAAEQWLQSRCPGAYILRPPYLYGTWNNVYREGFVFDCAMQGRKFYLPHDGGMKLQFYHVDDLCRFMEILLERHPAPRVFNVGNPQTVTVREWAALCYEAAGAVPDFAEVETGAPQRDYFCFHDYGYELDVSRQCALLPDVKPLREGLRETFAVYQAHPESVYFRKPYIEYIDKNFSAVN